MTKTFEKLTPEKQKTILDAAAYVFARKGYHQANVIDICKKAGISNGALYNYFKNKRDLYIQVFSSHINRLSEVFEQLYQRMKESDVSFFDMLDEMLSGTQDYVEQEKDYLKIYYDLGSAAMEEFTPDLSPKLEESGYRFWSKLVEMGKSKGEIRKDIPTEAVAYMLDNHFMILHFTSVSKHYDKRFTIYFKHQGEKISMVEKSSLMKHSLSHLIR